VKITIIIPLRITEHVYEAEIRLNRITDTVPEEYYNILVVDYGTPEKYSGVLKNINKKNISIVNIDCVSKPFSIGHARDIGVQYAKDSIVMFNDIDFYATRDMYKNIYDEAVSRDMNNCAYDFFCVPVFFMSEPGTIESLRIMSEHVSPEKYINKILIENQNGYVDFPAFGSSAIVVNKYHYLSLGGHSRAFYGHGAEDYDILHRLSSYNQKGPRTKDYYTNTKSNDIREYKGFRAFFALYGIDVFMKGIYFLHLHHPKRTIPGYQQTNRNFVILDELMRSFDKDRTQPFPLPDLDNQDKTLVLINTKSATFSALRQVFPLLGACLYIDEKDFVKESDLINYVISNRIDRVFMLNPYGNEHRTGLYTSLKYNNIDILVFDRGALPDSWFFDSLGFNFDSKTYHPQNWDICIKEEDIEYVENYSVNLINGSDTLENNGARRSADFLREKYNLGSKKILFVPFQRLSDTVTNVFAGAVGSVSGFQEWIDYINNNLPKHEWVVVCKNHPLEKGLSKINGVVYVDDNTHVHDLIELSDKVCLMNSGVGLIALAFKKPVICCSDAFYAHDGMAINANSKEHLLELIQTDLFVSKEKIIRFYFHLLKKVYSFGKTTYKKTVSSNGDDLNIATEIKFSNIIINGREQPFGAQPKGVSLDAPLFYSFGGRDKIKSILNSKPVTPPKSEKPASIPKNATAKTEQNTTLHLVSTKPEIVTTLNKRHVLQKKIRKLIKSPRAFVKDALIKKGVLS
jgi:predicted glycosyltransferase involved in capsule biosynthesis